MRVVPTPPGGSEREATGPKEPRTVSSFPLHQRNICCSPSLSLSFALSLYLQLLRSSHSSLQSFLYSVCMSPLAISTSASQSLNTTSTRAKKQLLFLHFSTSFSRSLSVSLSLFALRLIVHDAVSITDTRQSTAVVSVSFAASGARKSDGIKFHLGFVHICSRL